MATSTKHSGFKWTVGDESNKALAIVTPDANNALHITDANAANTDWNVSAVNNPTVSIHGATAPATTYLQLDCDGTDSTIDAVGTNLKLAVAGTDEITLSSVGLLLADTYGLVVGHTAQLTISDGDGATNLIPETQFLGSAQADGSAMLGTFNTTNTIASTLAFLKGGSATIGSATVIVADNEYIGRIIAYGCDGVDLESPVAEIRFVVNGTPGAGDMPGSIEFFTTADSGETLTKALTLEQDQKAVFAANLSIADAKSIQGASGNNKTLSIQVGSGTSATLQDIIKVSSATLLTKTELGFYNKTPTPQASAIAQTTTSAGNSNVSVGLNSVLDILSGVGLMAAT